MPAGTWIRWLAWRRSSAAALPARPVTTLERWFRWLEDRGDEDHPGRRAGRAVLRLDRAAGRRRAVGRRGRSLAARGRPAGSRPSRPVPLFRAPLCRDGVEQMRADADEAVRQVRGGGHLRARPRPARGPRASFPVILTAATLLRGCRQGRASESAARSLAVALSERSLLAMARGQWARPRPWPAGTLACCVGPGWRTVRDALSARWSPPRAARGRRPGGAAELIRAQRFRHRLTYAHAAPGRSGADRAHPRPPRVAD